MYMRMLLFGILTFVTTVAHATVLSTDQIKVLQSLSPVEQALLANKVQAGANSNGAKVPTTPKVVQSRSLEKGPVEAEVAKVTVDAAKQEQQVAVSAKVDVPIAQVNTGAAAEKLEVRRAFSDFVRESKPLTVDTSHLKQFGYELFAGTPTTFAPATDVPVPSEYVLGPGDTLKVQLFGQKNIEIKLIVDREGSVAFPEIGPIVLAGMNFSEAKALLAQQIHDKMIGVSASISMGVLRSIRVFALGDVARPGSYVVSGLATLSHALFVSGGVKKIGSLRDIQLKRAGKVVATLDLYRFLLHGDTSQDVRLLPGDVIFVPPIGATVGIAGEVIRPAIYEVKSGSSVGDIVKLAGGFLPKAYLGKSLLERINPSGEKSVQSFPLKGKSLEKKVRNGDVIKVFSTLDFEENPILLIGNVKRPGKYAWKRGMRLSDLLPNKKTLLPESFMDYGLIERESQELREPELLRFRLSGVFTRHKNNNLRLKPRDKVYVFHRSHFRQAPKLSVMGSVKSPGGYELKKNMRVLDALLAAGGLVRDSYMEEAELYRTDPKTKEVKIQHFSLEKAMQGSLYENVLLQDLDKIVVHSIWESRYRHEVVIQGEVKKTGAYALGQGMKLSELVFAAGGVTRNVFLGDVQVYRTNETTKDVSLVTVNLAKALKGNVQHNIALEDLDRVVLHSILEQRFQHEVNIQGEVKKAGQYPFGQGMKLSELVFAAGGLTRNVLLESVQIYRTDESTKDVSLLTVDLAKALEGDVQHNILLQDLDRVVIHSIWEKKKRHQVFIHGEVKKAGDYLFADRGMTLTDLLFAAGGVTEKAFLEKAEITRYEVIDGEKRVVTHMDVALQAALEGDIYANVALQAYDVVTIRQMTNWRGAEKVSVLGEVKYPGSYPIEDGERLSSLLTRVGGYADDAYLPAAVFTRDSIKNSQQKQMDDMANRIENEIAQKQISLSSIRDATLLERESNALESAKRVLVQMKQIKATGRLVIELQDIAGLRSSEFDLRLRDGDTLRIAKKPEQVSVIGQVYNTTALLYQRKWDRNDYLDMAGGLTSMADDDAIYIVRANGQVDSSQGWTSAKMYPGDVIVVPEKLEQFNLIDSMLDWSKVLMQVGVGAAAMKTLGVL